jgi:hypothetical protein
MGDKSGWAARQVQARKLLVLREGGVWFATQGGCTGTGRTRAAALADHKARRATLRRYIRDALADRKARREKLYKRALAEADLGPITIPGKGRFKPVGPLRTYGAPLRAPTKPLPTRAEIATPIPLAKGAHRPKVIAKTTVGKLCLLARVPARVTSPLMHDTIFLVEGRRHFGSHKACYVGVGTRFTATRVAALRVLEILARGFDNYCAGEVICDRGFFRPEIRWNRNGSICIGAEGRRRGPE